MIAFVALLGGVIVLALWIYAAVQFGNAAVDKGYPEKKTGIIVLCLFMPLAGYLLACALPDRRQQPQMIVQPVPEKPAAAIELPDL